MHTVTSRPQTRGPRKSSSYVSLRRDQQQQGSSFSFPRTDENKVERKPFLRERSRTSPSNWIERPIGPRISATSTLTEGTPPDTPVDNLSFDVLVAAPVSGVEMMDALVDGMNGGDESTFHNHHPLYQPPLPTPPPGVVLGGGKARRRNRRPSFSDDDDPSPPRKPAPASEKRKSLAPSISEIIRAYNPPPLSRTSSYSRSAGHATVHEESEPDLESLTAEISRSSIDSIADEVRRTLRHQNPNPNASPRSESFSMTLPPPSLMKPTTPSQAVAQYLRSARLTTLLKLTRSPHASHDNPLTVSLSDLGDQTGFPVLVFLGLGCVRHVMGLYDEMAQCLGLRLITIDRWGLGRTEPRSKSAKGIIQWASVVEEVLDLLQIEQCSVMAHSAGAPYALSFANKLKGRIKGDVCLLAPWVGESGGYKWLKYVPNGILKTAQAAEWKLQTWMIGKPPTMAWEGIGYTAQTASPISSNRKQSSSSMDEQHPPRPSINSTFSAYDDLGDFEGRFESKSTLPLTRSESRSQNQNQSPAISRKPSRGFLGRLKTQTQPQSPSDESISPSLTTPTTGGKKLKALRSMSSLRSKSSTSSRKQQQQPTPTSPQLPPTFKFDDSGLGILSDDASNWTKSFTSTSDSSSYSYSTPERSGMRANGKRSMSFSSSSGRPLNIQSLPPSPNPASSSSPYSSQSPSIYTSSYASDLPSPTSSNNTHLTATTSTSRFPSFSPTPSSVSVSSSTPTPTPTTSTPTYQHLLGNALIAASHSESSKGTHNDLLQILNHDHHPWGFTYTPAYPHRIQVWYGERDEKIGEEAVRWMERGFCGANAGAGVNWSTSTGDPKKCTVKIVKGADHGLMYKSAVVVEVLEVLRGFWD